MERPTRKDFEAHVAACRSCTVCADQGIIPEATPTFSGEWGAKILLVGQAPGPVERESLSVGWIIEPPALTRRMW